MIPRHGKNDVITSSKLCGSTNYIDTAQRIAASSF